MKKIATLTICMLFLTIVLSSCSAQPEGIKTPSVTAEPQLSAQGTAIGVPPSDAPAANRDTNPVDNSAAAEENSEVDESAPVDVEASDAEDLTGSADSDAEPEDAEAQADSETESPADEEEIPAPEEATVEPAAPESAAPLSDASGRLIVIDAGHQAKGNNEKEPIGPGSSTMKAKVASGTRGVATGIPEYELTLDIALRVQSILTAKGYPVMMVRTTNEVNISNAERAQIANNNNAAAFVRIHANGSENASVTGAMTICQTASNPYNAALHDKSKALSTAVLDNLVSATGCRRERVWETDTMSGINWCSVPVTIVEVGYMSNPEEDRLMASDDYKSQIASGIAAGIMAYIGP